MPGKFHVNPETGRSGACRATKKGCPLGANGEHVPHFDTKEEANKYISEQAKKDNETLTSLKKKANGEKRPSKWNGRDISFKYTKQDGETKRYNVNIEEEDNKRYYTTLKETGEIRVFLKKNIREMHIKDPSPETKEESTRENDAEGTSDIAQFKELNKKAKDLNEKYREARRQLKEHEKNKGYIKAAQEQIQNFPNSALTATAPLHKQGYAERLRSVKNADMPRELEVMLAEKEEAIKWTATAADGFKKKLDGVRAERNKVSARISRKNKVQPKAESAGARELSPELKKMGFEVDENRVESKSDNRSSYVNRSVYKPKGFSTEPETTVSLKLPNPKDVDKETFDKAVEASAEFLRQNPKKRINVTDKHASGGGAYTIQQLDNGEYTLVKHVRYSRYLRGNSDSLSEVMVQATNEIGFNDDEYDPFDWDAE